MQNPGTATAHIALNVGGRLKEPPAREGRALLEEFFRHLTSAARG